MLVSAGLGDLLLTMHVGMFLIKASYYNYIPSNMLFLGYEVFTQAE